MVVDSGFVTCNMKAPGTETCLWAASGDTGVKGFAQVSPEEGVVFWHRIFFSTGSISTACFGGTNPSSWSGISATINVPHDALASSTTSTASSRTLRFFFCSRVRAVDGGTVVAFVSGLTRKFVCTDVASPTMRVRFDRDALVRLDAGSSCHMSSCDMSALGVTPSMSTLNIDIPTPSLRTVSAEIGVNDSELSFVAFFGATAADTCAGTDFETAVCGTSGTFTITLGDTFGVGSSITVFVGKSEPATLEVRRATGFGYVNSVNGRGTLDRLGGRSIVFPNKGSNGSLMRRSRVIICRDILYTGLTDAVVSVAATRTPFSALWVVVRDRVAGGDGDREPSAFCDGVDIFNTNADAIVLEVDVSGATNDGGFDVDVGGNESCGFAAGVDGCGFAAGVDGNKGCVFSGGVDDNEDSRSGAGFDGNEDVDRNEDCRFGAGVGGGVDFNVDADGACGFDVGGDCGFDVGVDRCCGFDANVGSGCGFDANVRSGCGFDADVGSGCGFDIDASGDAVSSVGFGFDFDVGDGVDFGDGVGVGFSGGGFEVGRFEIGDGFEVSGGGDVGVDVNVGGFDRSGICIDVDGGVGFDRGAVSVGFEVGVGGVGFDGDVDVGGSFDVNAGRDVRVDVGASGFDVPVDLDVGGCDGDDDVVDFGCDDGDDDVVDFGCDDGDDFGGGCCGDGDFKDAIGSSLDGV
jgi:hypothetical protein